MSITTNNTRIINIEHESNSEAIWIDRESIKDGKVTACCVPVAAFGDADALVAAAKKIARLSF